MHALSKIRLRGCRPDQQVKPRLKSIDAVYKQQHMNSRIAGQCAEWQ